MTKLPKRSELLADLEALFIDHVHPDEVTAPQMAEAWGVTHGTASVRLAALVAAGKLAPPVKRRTRDGKGVMAWAKGKGR